MTFFWMMEKTISIWFSQEACTGVWIMIAFGCAVRSRSIAAWPRWSEPLSTMTNTRGAFLYSGRAMTWLTRSMNGAIPVVFGVEANTCRCARPARPAARASRGARIRVRRARACRARPGWWEAGGRGPGWRLGVKGQEPVARAQRLALVRPPVQVQNHRGLGLEVRGAGVDPGPVLPGLDRVLGQDPQHRRHRDLDLTVPVGDLGGQFRAGPAGQRHPGSGSSWQASATTAARVRADPPGPPGPGQITQPVQAVLRDRPRHLRTVSWLMPRSAAIRALARPGPRPARSAPAAGPARGSGPRTRFFSVLRSAAVTVTSTAGSGMKGSRTEHTG